tara:strand:- start:182 stop:283 length:102 start_codon:yes stop_codon:yes gene_type:complete
MLPLNTILIGAETYEAAYGKYVEEYQFTNILPK